jgi:hypothetical protein
MFGRRWPAGSRVCAGTPRLGRLDGPRGAADGRDRSRRPRRQVASPGQPDSLVPKLLRPSCARDRRS